MCGLTGFWSHTTSEKESVVRGMGHALVHRGPDDAGIWVDNDAGIALAHQRLSVMDLSPAGHQPMLSQCGRYVLIFNGEIYNHLDLRHELEAVTASSSVALNDLSWRGHSDTETLLAAVTRWGLQKTLTKLNGMFAFALWDRQERSLSLARDRMGEKPLYYGFAGKSFLFGSELKALTRHPDWQGEVDRDVLALYMRHNYVPSPWSIYKGIFKLPPAHFMTISDIGHKTNEPTSYWDLQSVIHRGPDNSKSEREWIDSLDALLRDAVGLRMAADVPLGAFLSGGYDSTMIAAQMQAQSEKPIKTFTIGFHEQGYNEATHAKAVAKHLGTEHTELYVTPEQAMAVIPNLPKIYDEPFADSSQIPTFLVSQLARQQVTVSLSGDGGDELFFGYERYFKAIKIWQKFGYIPAPLRNGLARLLELTPGQPLEKVMNVLPDRMRINHLADRLPKLANILRPENSGLFYRELVSHWKKPEEVVIGGNTPSTIFESSAELGFIAGFETQMQYLDTMTYLPDDILTKVDRASMAVSLEARVPLLDHRLVEFAARLPMQFKYRDGRGKWLLRKVLDRYVPQELMERPKMGFGVPIEHWLRGPLLDWAEELLDENRLKSEGYFNPEPIRQKWHEHLSGQRRWHYYLWDVLMFQAWMTEFK
jgi:asparagine synthase (glutamine-hydrolysing)